MKRFLFFLFFLSFIIIQCRRDFSVLDPTVPKIRAFTALERKLISASETFGFTLFEKVCVSDSGNIFISPLSVSMALAMTANGAAGETLTGMLNTLGFGAMTPEEMNQTYQSLIPLLSELDPLTVMQIANSIWIRQTFDVEQDFITNNEEYYFAQVYRLDFSAPNAPSIINSWVNEQTHGLIPEVIDSINPLTVMFLINALYFRGIWATQFDPAETEDDLFESTAGPVPCRMMTMDSDLNNFESHLLQAVELPYGNGAFAMAVLLPKRGIGLQAFIDQFDEDLWNEITAGFDTRQLSLRLPRFQIKYEKKLNDILIDMGMADAFDPPKADFTGINRNGGLYIGEVRHHSFVSTDEEGTEAAAVTVVTIDLASMNTMTVDRPFIFVIYEKVENTIIFMGRVDEPDNL